MTDRPGFLAAICAIGVLLCASSLGGQQATFPVEFSASLIDYVPPYPSQARQAGRLFVSKQRVRLETGAPGEAHQIVQILDAGGHVWMLMADNRIALNISDETRNERHSYGASSSSTTLSPVDPSQPCADFKEVTCRALGAETLAGRNTAKWEFTQLIHGHPVKSYQWIDTRLHVALKREDHRSGRQLHDLREAPQPDSLFRIPADYHQMPPQNTPSSKAPASGRHQLLHTPH